MRQAPLKCRIPLLGFAAPSGSGKTTLLQSVLPILLHNGYRVGLIKHAHHAFEVDQPGKDSYELRKAGACPLVLTSSRRRVIFFDHPEPKEPSLGEELVFFERENLDILLVEGFKREAFPKIEIHRPSLGLPPLYPDDPWIIAVASNAPLVPPPDIPVLNLGNPNEVTEFIVKTFLENPSCPPSVK